MNANEWARNRVIGQPNISSQAAPFPLHQYGWSLSGPLYIPNHFNKEKNKLFFLFSEEWTKFRREALQQQVVPTDAMKRGDFSRLLGANSFFRRPAVYTRSPQEPALAVPRTALPASTATLFLRAG